MTPEILEVEVNPPALDLVSLAYVLPRILMRHYEALVDLDPLVDMALCDLLLLIYACFGIVLLVFIPSPLFVCVYCKVNYIDVTGPSVEVRVSSHFMKCK